VVFSGKKTHHGVMMQTQNFQSFREELGARIQCARQQKGYSQEDLAALLDMHRVSVGYIEQGKQSPKLSTLYRLAHICGVSMRDLLPDEA